MNQDGKRGHKTKLTGTSSFRRLRSTLEEEEEEEEKKKTIKNEACDTCWVEEKYVQDFGGKT